MYGESQAVSEQHQLVSLKDFINDHQKILAVIGVFVALSVFWGNLPLKPISAFVSFLCLAATVPLFLEIARSYDHKKSSWLLVIFINIFFPLMGYTAFFLLVAYREQWRTQINHRPHSFCGVDSYSQTATR
jgi:uncharacterized membrane protein YbaN (DUF454 family)